MKQLHIVTVGISLLANYAKAKKLPPETALQHSQQLRKFLKADPKAACAEVNSLDARTGLLGKRPKDMAVSLVWAATAKRESELAAKLIGNFLKERGVKIVPIKLADIGVPANPQADPAKAARLAQEGLMVFYNRIKRHVKRLRKQFPDLRVEFNATGGFKAECAVLYGLGCDLGVPVYYQHETYRVPITLPVCRVPF
jgi:putative CRISPR-associated protein (TIGR02619 family)